MSMYYQETEEKEVLLTSVEHPVRQSVHKLASEMVSTMKWNENAGKVFFNGMEEILESIPDNDDEGFCALCEGYIMFRPIVQQNEGYMFVFPLSAQLRIRCSNRPYFWDLSRIVHVVSWGCGLYLTLFRGTDGSVDDEMTLLLTNFGNAVTDCINGALKLPEAGTSRSKRDEEVHRSRREFLQRILESVRRRIDQQWDRQMRVQSSKQAKPLPAIFVHELYRNVFIRVEFLSRMLFRTKVFDCLWMETSLKWILRAICRSAADVCCVGLGVLHSGHARRFDAAVEIFEYGLEIEQHKLYKFRVEKRLDEMEGLSAEEFMAHPGGEPFVFLKYPNLMVEEEEKRFRGSMGGYLFVLATLWDMPFLRTISEFVLVTLHGKEEIEFARKMFENGTSDFPIEFSEDHLSRVDMVRKLIEEAQEELKLSK
eukprot:TRINITY_DN755_c2_g1_i1.p1 TRINITY_DN755_c2_g1~~TRINITY_DN755_c2_g1_i1.p1  ORF type:complete len:425 (+),score=97.39 TRINITY_DN755_c2_g1_i1:329-1603(+)